MTHIWIALTLAAIGLAAAVTVAAVTLGRLSFAPI